MNPNFLFKDDDASGATPDPTPTPEPAVDDKGGLAVPDASADQETLENHIDAELGIDPPKKPADESTDKPDDKEVTPPVEAEADDDEDASAEADADEDVDEDTNADEAEASPSDEAYHLEVEDANGKKYKVSSIDDLPEDFEPKNNRQVIELLDGLNKLETAKKEAQAAENQKADAALVERNKNEQLTSWDTEIKDLRKEGRLDKPKIAAGEDGFMDDLAVKKVDGVFKLMAEINAKRQAAGNPNLLRSFEDALDKYEAIEARKATDAAKKTETDLAKQKAGLIGKSSAAASNDAPVYVAGSARSIWDI